MSKEAEQVSLYDLGLWSGKTSPERSPATVDKTSGASSKRSLGSRSRKPPTFHYLQKESGQWLTAGMAMAGPLPTEYTMDSFGECPSVAVVSHLSQILEDTPHPKYCLTAAGCAGILKRSAERGKEMPLELEAVLTYQRDHYDEILALLTSAFENAAGFNFKAGAKAGSIGYAPDCAPTLQAERQSGVLVYENHSQDSRYRGPLNVSPTMSRKWGTGGNNTPIVVATGQANAEITEDMSPTLNCNHEQPIVIYGISAHNSKAMLSDNPHNGIYRADTARTLDNNGGNPTCNQGGILIMQPYTTSKVAHTLRPNSCYPYRLDAATYVIEPFGYTRRFTPLECERLQGFPDGWTDIGEWTDSKGKLHKASSDSARYRALGNSIALPPWKWVLKRISALYERDVTMGSLFDGIGGFPLIWEQLNGAGSCLWASEIDEFCIAVTKRQFGREVSE